MYIETERQKETVCRYRVCVCRERERERDSGSVCRVRKCLFREKESERMCMSISITIDIESVCEYREREKSVYKERERDCV